MNRFLLFALVLLRALPAAPSPEKEAPGQLEPSPSPSRENTLDVLVAGGDTVLARWEHDMVSRNGYDWPLEGVRDLLTSADAALCNLECCVSVRGMPAEKGERCPFYYRARPAMLHCITRAGIDIVTAANNHGGDYGPTSVSDTLRWTTEAGLVCVGIGADDTEAEKPRLVCIGRTRVGIAGMDTTMRHFRATDHGAGTNFADEGGDLSLFTEKMRRLGAWAHGRCDILILTIHWGANWVKATQPAHRQMARIACSHGVDCILGHSAHRLQGIEVLDGKPVIYDMGNVLFDCALKPEGVRSALFRLHLSPKGVHKIEVIPTLVLNGHTVPAGHDDAGAILTEMKDLCASLHTDLTLAMDAAGHRVGTVTIPRPTTSRRSPPDRNLACATFPAQPVSPSFPFRGSLAKEIPAAARKLLPPEILAPGVELCAVRLPEKAREAGILTITTWWRVTSPVKDHVLPAFHLSVSEQTTRRGTPWYTRHDARDWTVPLSRMKAGELVEDRYPARLAGIPAGPCRVSAVAIDTSLPEARRVLGTRSFLGTVTIEPRMQK